jgi:acetyl-CoA C-acetyltransferase
MEALATLRPAFQKDGTVTAGNASGINDGAAALVLARGTTGGTPRARIMGYAVAGVAPDVMGLGPIPAVQALCRRLGMRPGDFDLVESNEAFAAQALAVSAAIALGHPVGATGALITVKALSELERNGGRTALITLCIGGGQGIALAIERV